MEQLFVFMAGASGYGVLEVIWRGYTHWTMQLLGGVCFLILYDLFYKIKTRSVILKCILGGSIITVLELISGVIINIVFGLNVWDYSDMRLNLSGQICLSYSILWMLLSLPIVYLSKIIKEKVYPYLIGENIGNKERQP